MIVENGSVTMDLDLNRLNGISFAPVRPAELQFTVAANSFFTILVFNDLLRGPDSGSMALMPSEPSRFGTPCVISWLTQPARNPKASVGRRFDLAVRDSKTGFTFFNIEGGQYDYDANAKLLSITGGRLLVSKEFAESLGRPSDAGAVAGEISIGATMQPIEIMQLDQNGDVKSARLPALNQPGVGTVPGPDVIIGELIGLTAIDQWCSKWPRGDLFGNRCLQQRDGERGLVCLAEQRPSLYSAESLSHEWRRH